MALIYSNRTVTLLNFNTIGLQSVKNSNKAIDLLKFVEKYKHIIEHNGQLLEHCSKA